MLRCAAAHQSPIYEPFNSLTLLHARYAVSWQVALQRQLERLPFRPPPNRSCWKWGSRGGNFNQSCGIARLPPQAAVGAHARRRPDSAEDLGVRAEQMWSSAMAAGSWSLAANHRCATGSSRIEQVLNTRNKGLSFYRGHIEFQGERVPFTERSKVVDRSMPSGGQRNFWPTQARASSPTAARLRRIPPPDRP